MCHACSIATNLEALQRLRFTFEVASNIGNLAPQTGIYPDMRAPIIRSAPGGFRGLVKMRWGMPTSSRALYLAAKERARKIAEKQGRDLSQAEFDELVLNEPDRVTHSVRNTDSLHRKRRLTPEFRCKVPFTSFAELSSQVGPDGKKLGNTWFAFDADRPLACRARQSRPPVSVHELALLDPPAP